MVGKILGTDSAAWTVCVCVGRKEERNGVTVTDRGAYAAHRPLSASIARRSDDGAQKSGKGEGRHNSKYGRREQGREK